MRKTILKITLGGALAVTAAMGVQMASSNKIVSNIFMQHIEALANGESGGGNLVCRCDLFSGQNCAVNNRGAICASGTLQYTKLQLDTIKMEHVEAAYLGTSGITLNDEFYFLNTYYCQLFIFDTLGNFKKRYLGQGRAPHEISIGKIAFHTPLQNKGFFFLGYQLDHYVYDSTLRVKHMFMLKSNTSKDPTETSSIYTHQYSRPVCRNYKEKVYFNMYCQNHRLDYLSNSKEYMEKCRQISEVNIKTKEDGRMLGGGLPEPYKKDPKKYIHFSAVNFDIDKQGNFYVSYDAHPVIYKYDNDYNPITSFGYPGRDMDMNYKTIDSYKEARKVYDDERENRGHYNWVEYIDETGLLFRSYAKGSHQKTDGLQIYRGNTLIADVDVPKNFKIAGYINPYYYSQAIIDEEKEEMTVFKFKLQ